MRLKWNAGAALTWIMAATVALASERIYISIPAWEARLEAEGVPVEGRMTWGRGGQSLYFRDPDGHLGELATPGVWAIY